jgi:hypothetical protein
MIKVVLIEDEIPAQRLLKETLREITIKTEVVAYIVLNLLSNGFKITRILKLFC